MKKNVIVIRSNSVNPDSRVEKEACALKKKGYHVRILAWDRDSNYKYKNSELKIQGESLLITRFGIKSSFGEGMKNIRQFIIFQLRVALWLVKHRREVDIIHACDFDTAFTSSIVNRFIRKKFVFDIFDYLSTDAKSGLRKVVKKLEDSIINYADAVILCTEQRKQQIAGTHPKKIVIIHNSPVFSTQIKDFPIRGKEDAVKIVYVGILQDYRLLKEITHVIQDEKEIEFHVAGFGKYEKFFQELDTENSNIFFYGKLSYENTIALENKADIMTAIYAPWIGNHIYAAPNKFYESLMLGKAVIMIKGTGMSEIIEKNKFGSVVEYSEEGFRQGIKNIMQLKEGKDSIKNRMNQVYMKQYSWKEMEERLLSLYDSF